MSIVFQQAADTTTVTLTSMTSASEPLNRPSGNPIGPMVACVLNNDPDEPAFIRFGASDVEATTANAVPIAIGERAFLMVPQGATHVAAIAAGTATGDVFVTLGYATNAH